MSPAAPPVAVRRTHPEDFAGIIGPCRAVYPSAPAWSREQLASHLCVFPEGQFVATEQPGGAVVGMAASLIVLWDDYSITTSWRDFTDQGMFTNHDPVRGRTRYGAEVMVHPRRQGMGIGKQLYAAREAPVRRLGLLRIRAGARLRDSPPRGHPFPGGVRGTRGARRARGPDAVVPAPAGLPRARGGIRLPAARRGERGHAAVIEWLNPEVAG